MALPSKEFDMYYNKIFRLFSCFWKIFVLVHSIIRNSLWKVLCRKLTGLSSSNASKYKYVEGSYQYVTVQVESCILLSRDAYCFSNGMQEGVGYADQLATKLPRELKPFPKSVGFKNPWSLGSLVESRSNPLTRLGFGGQQLLPSP